MSGSGRPLPLNFSSRTASTGILADDNTYIEKGEFELTLKAEVGPADELNTSLTEGFWACICTAKIGGEIQSRDILLPSSSWDKPDKFKTNLRRAFVGANMWIDFSPKQLSAYYKYLKEQYRSRGERKLYLVEVLGRQPESDYWVFSREIHCEQFQVLDVEEQRYFLPRNSPLVQYSSSMENVDVSFDYIGELRALIPLMAEAFSHNFYPVVRLLAYAVSSFYKKDVEEIFEGLSTMIVYCKDKNVGKTAALKFLSRLLGFGRKKHPSMITGASGPGSGTPSSEILNKLKLSTFPVLCDDTNLPSGMKSLLVSLKDGFSQSTKEDGNRTPEGQLILTSNKLPTLDERASSRILLNSFRKKGLQVSRKQQKALEDLKVKAWSLDQMILFFVYLGSGLEDQKETINDIKEIVKFMLPEIMERTAVDLSIQLFYSSKLLAVSGFGSFAQALRMFVDTQYNDVKKFHAAEIDFIPEASDAIHSLVALLEKELEDIEEQELMCFALPGVNTKVNEEKIKCVSIAIDFLNQRKMNSVDKNILHDFVIAKYGEKHWGETDYFKKDGVSASHKTIRSRDKAKARGRKAFRIPEKCLPRLFVERLYHVCDILDQLEIPTLEAESEEESNENVIGKILEKHAENIRKIHDKIAKFDMSENSMLQEIGIFKEFDPYLYDVSLDRLHVTEELESMEGSSGYPSDGMESGDEGTGERLEETGADATDVVEVGEDVHESPVLNAKNIPTQLQGVDKIRSVDEEQESCGTNDGPNKRSSEQRTGFSPASKSGRIDSDPNRNTVRRNLDFDDDTANASKVNQKGKTEKKKYVYCICKKRRNKNVEKGMLLCETDDRDMCPGKGYYHKHCLGYKEVPKESPWLCGSCKSKGGSEIYDATSTLDESESASA